jgi:hypothetical protein
MGYGLFGKGCGLVLFFNPMGIFLTYKAVNDSVIMNADTYLNALKNLFGKKESGKLRKKKSLFMILTTHH